MRRFLYLTVSLLFFGNFVFAQTTNKNALRNERDKEELLRLENELFQASNQKDAATLNRLLADDLVATSTEGKMADKKKIVAYWTKKTPGASDETCALSDSRVSVVGATAVVVGLDTCKVQDKDGERTVFQDSFTDLWMKRKGRWQLVSTIAPPFKPSQNATSDAQKERDKLELTRLTNEILQSAIEDDAAPLERLLDKDYLHINFSNQSSDKATIIKRYTTKPSDETAKSTITASDFQIRFYGDTAVVAYKVTDVFRGKKGEQTFHDSQFDVWKRSGKDWRLLASSGAMQFPERKVIMLDAKILDAYAGVYKSANGDSFTITRDGEKLLVSISDGTKFDLAPQTEIEFHSPSNSIVAMFFVRDEKGAVGYAIMRYYGADTTLKKIK